MTAGHTREQYVADETLQLACERSVQIIGEAVRNLPAEVLDAAPEVARGELRQMRNFLVHVYFGVNPATLWDNAVEEIPPLHASVLRLIAELEAETAEPPSIESE